MSSFDHEVIVIGAGVSGIYQIKRLVDLGVDATVLEADQCLSRDDCEGGLMPPLNRDTTAMP